MNISKIQEIVQDFKNNYQEYKNFSEANVETQLVEPLFMALGWDRKDFSKQTTAQRDGKSGRADYAFKIEDRIVFFLEVKRIGIPLDKEADKQVISYALSKRVPFAISTNFEELKIFCVESQDKSLLRRFTKPEEYISNSQDFQLLSKESFKTGDILKKAEVEGRLKKRVSIDKILLSDLMNIRELIAKDIEKNYSQKYEANEKEEIIQRIIDRLIFIRRCEDTNINPDNLVLEEIRQLPHNKAYPQLKNFFVKYNNIYNSGLFAIGVDNDCDKIDIDGEIIKKLIGYLYKSKDGKYYYDFHAIDADVLGQVYEQYLGKILQQTKSGRSKLKDGQAHRKEQGIYYTPTYIVDYIVKNTIGEMLKDKKINAKDIKILDPACGSGSFLIKAFDYIYEHRSKDPESKQHRLDSQGMYSVKTDIIKNNLYGVDLDNKALEITKLNLLLKAAEKDRKLPDELHKNIQQGNSLIDDEKVADLLTFKWEERFKNIMDKGGFDIVIGNPPYIRIQTLDKNQVDYFNKEYQAATKNYDIYALFVERGLSLLRKGGILGFILPSKFINADYGKGLRKVISRSKSLHKFVDFKDFQIFDGATTYTCLLFLKKNKNMDMEYIELNDKEQFRITRTLSNNVLSYSIQKEPSDEGTWSFASGDKQILMEKMNTIKLSLRDISKNIFQGLVTGSDKFYFVHIIEDKGKLIKIKNNYDGNEHIIEKILLKKLLKGKEIKKWFVDWKDIYIIYPYSVKNGKAKLISLEEIKRDYPKTYKYFTTYQIELKSREKNRFKNEKNWHQFGRLQNIEKFEQSKIMTQVLASENKFTFDEKGEFYFVGGGNAGGYGIVLKNEYINKYYIVLGILNSRLLEFYLKNISTPFRGGYYSYGKRFIEKLPIILPSGKEGKLLESLVKKQLMLHEQLKKFGDKKTTETARLESEIMEKENKINEIVYKIYKITKTEMQIIEESLK